jgi:hypothetical protein
MSGQFIRFDQLSRPVIIRTRFQHALHSLQQISPPLQSVRKDWPQNFIGREGNSAREMLVRFFER